MSLLRSSATVGLLTLLSRVFGFIRDVLVADIMGAGPLSDAFLVAFKIPNFFRKLFAEGAFNAAFLPMFAGMLKVKGKEVAMHFASSIMSALIVVLILVSVVSMYFMGEILALIAPGFHASPEIRALTIELSRITFPYLIFISLVSLLSGILNSYDKFVASTLNPVLLNIAMIFTATCVTGITKTDAHALAYGVLLAGILQLAWMIHATMQFRVLPRVQKPVWDDDVRTMLHKFVPVAFSAGIVQVNQLIDMILASYMDSAVSYLYYADRLYELPLGVIGIAIATALLPMLSRHIRANEHEEARRAIDEALRFCLLVGLPATVALIAIADPIIRIMYEHGQFDASDSNAVIPALIAYAWGLPSFLMIKVFSSSFFAAQDTKTPVKIALICMCVNLVGNLILSQYYQHVGLAASTSISGWLNAFLLGYMLKKKGVFSPSRELIQWSMKIVVAVLGMAVLLELCESGLSPWLHSTQLAWQVSSLSLLIVAGTVTYGVGIVGTGVVKRSDLQRWLQKNPKK